MDAPVYALYVIGNLIYAVGSFFVAGTASAYNAALVKNLFLFKHKTFSNVQQK